jgi:hypothetical protein
VTQSCLPSLKPSGLFSIFPRFPFLLFPLANCFLSSVLAGSSVSFGIGCAQAVQRSCLEVNQEEFLSLLGAHSAVTFWPFCGSDCPIEVAMGFNLSSSRGESLRRLLSSAWDLIGP